MYRCLIFLAALLPAAVFAHPGHDHSHWASGTVHALLALSVIGVVAVFYMVVRRNARKAPSKNKAE